MTQIFADRGQNLLLSACFFCDDLREMRLRRKKRFPITDPLIRKSFILIFTGLPTADCYCRLLLPTFPNSFPERLFVEKTE